MAGLGATLLSHYTLESRCRIADTPSADGQACWTTLMSRVDYFDDVGSCENLSHQSVLKGRGFSRAVRSCIKVGGFSP